jgi:hypothetical protein
LEDVPPISSLTFRFKNGRKDENIAIVLTNRCLVKIFLWVLSEAIAPGTESMRMLKHAKIATVFRNVFLRIATSF